MIETKKRSLIKTIAWRVAATGFFIYYMYERVWNCIKWGKITAPK